MKKIIKYGIVLSAVKYAVLLGVFLFVSANAIAAPFTKMAKEYTRINVVANPEVVTLVGKNVKTDVTVTFPAKFFNAKAVVRITPVLRYEGGETEGSAKYLQGEKVKDNYTKIANKAGGMYTQSVSFPWKPEYKNSTLVFKVEGVLKKNIFVTAGYIDITKGTNALQQEFAFEDAMVEMADNFQRITHQSAFADLMYAKNSASVNSKELTKTEVKAFGDFIKQNTGKERVKVGNVQAKGYASPEGPEDNNAKLSQNRGASAKAAVGRSVRGSNKTTFEVASFGEDWDGFKKAVEESDMADKQLVLQVLETYSSSAERDNAIRNMTAVFEELQRDILPRLRRTQLSVTADVEGKSDAELQTAVKQSISQLDVEELLFAAKLYADDLETKTTIYQEAADRFNDARAWNNLAVVYAFEGQWADAKTALDKAAVASTDAAIANNTALVMLQVGDVDGAKEYLSAATAATNALAAACEGRYAEAAGKLSGYNKAVAELLNNNISAAKSAIADNVHAGADYLRAIIAVREGDNAAAVESARSAIAKDPAFGDKIKDDINLSAIADQL